MRRRIPIIRISEAVLNSTCAEHKIEVIRAFESDPGYMDTLRDVPALICIGKYSDSQRKNLETLSSHVLFLDMRTPQINCNTITLDFGQAVYDAMNYLTGLGHRPHRLSGRQRAAYRFHDLF